ncbi:MAG: nucleotidyltransferase family protein [Thermoplasmata archaeon]
MVYGIIFVGGYGKRLRPLTDKIPKVLLEIKRNYTILDKQLLDFKYSGINNIYLLVGYKWKLIKKRYGDFWNGININYLVEKKPMGTLWALRNCIKYLDDDAIVRNGDTVSDINLKMLINDALKKDYGLLIALTKMKSPYAVVETYGDRIKSFVEKPFLNHYVNAGTYYIKKDVFKYIFKDYKNKEIEKTFIPELVSMGIVGSFFDDSGWFPVDNFKDLEELRKEYKGRIDKDFGYIKKNEDIQEIYIKALYKAYIKRVGKIEIIKGSGLLNGIEIFQGEVKEIKNPWHFEARENTIIKLTSL